MKRQHYIISSAYTEYKTCVKGIQIFINTNLLNAVIFHGRRSDPTIHFSNFDSIDALLISIDKKVKLQYDENIQKIKRAQEKKTLKQEQIQNVQIGDIFATSWGYDETHVEFFQVIAKSTKTRVTIRQINKISISGSMNNEYITPMVNSFISEPKICTINHFGAIVKADRYGHNAYKTEAEKLHYTSWGR